jgi:alpha-aminoadipic semialdehyde synthase
MSHSISKVGIRAETMHRFERRVPIIPDHMKELGKSHGIQFVVQRSPIRIFKADEFREAGAEIVTELGDNTPVVFGVKQMPTDFFSPEHTYVFFSHVIKGQRGNMNMLKAMMDRNCTLIDYEKIIGGDGNRLVAFGRFAGIAGMTDTLYVLGRRLEEEEGIRNPFSVVKQTIWYRDLNEVKKQIRLIGEDIHKNGLPSSLNPLIVGITGHGRCAQGALEIFDLLNPKEVKPNDLLKSGFIGGLSNKEVYKAVFERVGLNGRYIRKDRKPSSEQDFENDPYAYETAIPNYLHLFTLLIHNAFWKSPQPSLVTKDLLLSLQGSTKNHLRVIGDISCDVWPTGPMESTVKGTEVEQPFYVFNPADGEINPGWLGSGVVVNALETMPCELPYDASVTFSNMLFPFIPGIVKADYSREYDLGILSLPESVRPAVILWNGNLTPDYLSNQDIIEGLKEYAGEFHDPNV